jgi:RNA polymerase sigma factor (sigma-70 family)
MHESDDNELLAQYARNKSEEAFAALVARHVNLVYSVALRHVANSHQAEEITQVVFLLLAKKAGSLSQKTILSGWLYRTARLTAANYLRMENRRQRREQEVQVQSFMNESEPDVWTQIAPVLDAAMARLGERERNAVVLRFFEGKSLKEVGSALGASKDAAQKNVERALKKLRNFFTKRGITLSAATLIGVLSTQSVQAAPAGLAESIITAGITKGAAISGPSLILMKSTLKMMAWLKIKTAVAASISLILIAGTATVAIAQIQKNMASDSQASEPATVEKSLPSQQAGTSQPAPIQHGTLVAANDTPKASETVETPPTVTTGYGVSGLVLWLAADSGVTLDKSGGVTALADKTGNFVLTSTAPNQEPTYVPNGLNGRPVLRFNGNQSLYSSDNFGNLLNRDMTFIVVTMTTASPDLEQFPLYLGQNATPHVNRDLAYYEGKELFDGQFVACYGTPVVTNTFVMTGASINSTLTEATFYRNGRQMMVGTVNDANRIEHRNAAFEDLSDGVTMGAATDPCRGWQGDIAEELVYDHQLTPTEMQFVWYYLSNKYGLRQTDTTQSSAEVTTPAATKP